MVLRVVLEVNSVSFALLAKLKTLTLTAFSLAGACNNQGFRNACVGPLSSLQNETALAIRGYDPNRLAPELQNHGNRERRAILRRLQSSERAKCRVGRIFERHPWLIGNLRRDPRKT